MGRKMKYKELQGKWRGDGEGGRTEHQEAQGCWLCGTVSLH